MAFAHATDSPPFTFGIEEEFFLVNPDSRNALSRVPARLMSDVRKRFGELIAPEMLQSQIEISSPIFHDYAEALARMASLRAGLGEMVAARGFQLMAAGTHPLAAWREQNLTRGSRYRDMAAGFQILGRRNLVCGLHVHVEIPAGTDRIDVMNRAMRWLPLFLALSTSSPFWNRHDTGLMSYRQSAYDEWPRSGIPDKLADEQEYDKFVDVMRAAKAMPDASYLWWAIRPASKFPTLELRIADACTRLEDTLALASLFRCLVATLVADPSIGREHCAYTRMVIEENRWRAKREGTRMQFIDHLSGSAISFPAALAVLCELVQDQAKKLNSEEPLAHLNVIVDRGTSAHRQREIYQASRNSGRSHLLALRDIVDWLTTTTLIVEVSN